MRNGQQSSGEVLAVLRKAAYFSIFSVPDSEQLSQGIPLIPFGNLLYKISIIESPRRHQITVAPPSPSHGFVTRMIGSEQRIARMAADGASNKEIAPSLFLTVKTVEMHLSNA